MELSWTPPKLTTTKATFAWGGSEAPYAIDIWAGEPRLGGRANGRHWDEVGVADFPFGQTFKANYQGDLSVAFEQTMQQLGDIFKNVIDNYEFGGATENMKQYRDLPTGSVITDSGNLRDSQTLTFE